MSMGAGSVGRFGSMIDPANLAVSGTAKVGAGLLGNAPQGLYKSAAKLPKRFDQDAVTRTALGEGIMPTDAGITRGRGLISDIGGNIDDIVQNSVNSGQKIDRTALYQHLSDVYQDVGGVNLDAMKNIKKVNKIVDDFEAHMDSIGKQNITAAEAQKFKQDIYKSINWKAKQGTGSETAAKTRKAIARGAKDEIERLIPEIKDLNLRQGDIIELLDAIDAPAARIANRDMIGLGMPAKIITGSLVGDTSGAVAGFLLGLADSPTLKAKLALGINDIKKMDISNARKRVLTVELLRNAGAQEDQE